MRKVVEHPSQPQNQPAHFSAKTASGHVIGLSVGEVTPRPGQAAGLEPRRHWPRPAVVAEAA
jgi:hypothetical protein